jgi:hypothetical protein
MKTRETYGKRKWCSGFTRTVGKRLGGGGRARCNWGAVETHAQTKIFILTSELNQIHCSFCRKKKQVHKCVQYLKWEKNISKIHLIFWRIDPLLSGDSVYSGRCSATPTTCKQQRNIRVIQFASEQRLGKYVPAETNTQATIKTVSSMWSSLRSYHENSWIVSCQLKVSLWG